jgi:hypothetical protein
VGRLSACYVLISSVLVNGANKNSNSAYQGITMKNLPKLAKATSRRALSLALLLPTLAFAIVPVNQPPPALVAVDINILAGDQFNPRLSGDWVSQRRMMTRSSGR